MLVIVFFITKKLSAMKKTLAILTIMVTTSSIINVSTAASPREHVDDMARVSCSATVNGITYTVSAGSIFTSTETAAARCAEKLSDAINAVQ